MDASSIPQVFFERSGRRGEKTAHMVKRDGLWQGISWQQLRSTVRLIARGLLTLDLQAGDRVAILSDNRAQWVQCDLGIMSAAGITVPVYASSTPDQAAYILQDAGVTALFIDTSAQLDKIMAMRTPVPSLKHLVIMVGDAPGNSDVLTLAELIRRGRDAAGLESVLEERLQSLTPDHDATYVYTSGTTGPPKGVVQTHGNHLFMMESCSAITDLAEGEVNLLFLPLAHSFARLESFLGIYQGWTTAFAESIDALARNMREVKPVTLAGVPRVYEKVYAGVHASVARSAVKRAIFNWGVGVGLRVSRLQQMKQPLPFGLRLQRNLAYRLVFNKLRQRLGGRLRYLISGGAPLPRKIAEFFHAAGLPILEGYGMTETCPALAANRHDRYKVGTVGSPLPGVELRLDEDGEILARGPNIAKGYYRQPEATAEVFLADGWFATGDVGEIDAEGFLRITDRKKDMLLTAGGHSVAPQNLEKLLTGDPLISQAMVYGDRRPFLTAVLTLDEEAARAYARQLGISGDTIAELAADPQIRILLEWRVQRVNQGLAPYETIKNFVIAREDFSEAGNELTPTLKLKRQVVTEKYRAELE
ncbi:MAG: long-chain fatty acid--CoA ligase, partial [Candidatus Tectomicrobia bacterium]|nr:long-chain fatty acid--CoA ligase [Candidatus Tectomicrobia bacterium]